MSSSLQVLNSRQHQELHETKDEDASWENEDNRRYIGGLLASYADDQLNDCVNSALRKKSRVKYRCMDARLDYLAFGTSGGAIYLFKMDPFNRSLCALESMTPCDQGSVEVIRFLPHPQQSEFVVAAIGTSRGSLVLFRFRKSSVSAGNGNTASNGTKASQLEDLGVEIYRAESFTGNHASIKLLEFDFYSQETFDKLYICDSTNRVYVLERQLLAKGNLTGPSLIQRAPFFGTPNTTSKQQQQQHPLPSLIMSLNDTKINQLSVYKSLLLISSDENCRLFNEQSCQMSVIGSKKRREGFFGATFFNPHFRKGVKGPLPTPNVASSSSSLQSEGTNGESSYSADDQQIMFIARPLFRLWQANLEGSVICTHQFEQMIRQHSTRTPVELTNSHPPDEVLSAYDDQQASHLEQQFEFDETQEASTGRSACEKSAQPPVDHFQRLQPIHTLTMGNLLLSYTSKQLFVVDPVGAEVMALLDLQLDGEQILDVSCVENELFVWTQKTNTSFNLETKQPMHQKQGFQVRRVLLLAPTQFVLELHRLQRHLSLICFVQMFSHMFCERMAVPLAGSAIITTEGGLLRNIMINAWHNYRANVEDNQVVHDGRDLQQFERIINQILFESRQLRESFDDIINSRLFLEMKNENMERLCSEPYASLVSLEVSIADLHSKHVIHFERDTLSRHRSIANLSQGMQKVRELRKASSNQAIRSTGEQQMQISRKPQLPSQLPTAIDSKVIVERQRPRRPRTVAATAAVAAASNLNNTSEPKIEEAKNLDKEKVVAEEEAHKQVQQQEASSRRVNSASAPCWRCATCQWPRASAHLLPMDSSQIIQSKWIQGNLMSDFANNLDQIERIAFKHALWPLYLDCLLAKDEPELFATCCLMLDDVRLLTKLDQLNWPEQQLADFLLSSVAKKQEQLAERESGTICLHCSSELPSLSESEERLEMESLDDPEVGLARAEERELRQINLVNLFERILMKRSADVRATVAHLLKYPKLINTSHIGANFYLRAIATATLIAKQSPLSRARLNQLRGVAASAATTPATHKLAC